MHHPLFSRRKLGALIAFAVFGVSVNAHAADPIDIGVVAALTGYLASVDKQFVDGAKLAADVINSAGGVNGRKLNLHVMDSGSNATNGVTVTNQLLKQQDIKIMLNGALSALSVGIQPIVEKAEVPVIAVAQLPPNATWVFLTGIAYQSTLDTQLLFARDRLKAKKVAFLYGQTPYGQNGAKLIAARAKALGLEVVLSESVAATTLDMTPHLGRVKEAKPDVLIDFMTGPIHIVQAKAAATVGLPVPIVMAVDDDTIFTQAAAAYANSFQVVAPVQVFPNVPDKSVKSAADTFLSAYNKARLDPHGITGASWGWDAVQLAAAALRTTNGAGGKPLRDALEKLDFVGSTTRYKFGPDDHTGQSTAGALAVSKISGGKHEVIFSGGVR